MTRREMESLEQAQPTPDIVSEAHEFLTKQGFLPHGEFRFSTADVVTLVATAMFSERNKAKKEIAERERQVWAEAAKIVEECDLTVTRSFSGDAAAAARTEIEGALRMRQMREQFIRPVKFPPASPPQSTKIRCECCPDIIPLPKRGLPVGWSQTGKSRYLDAPSGVASWCPECTKQRCFDFDVPSRNHFRARGEQVK